MPLKGSLKDFNLPDLFQLISFGKKSGTLILSKGDAKGYVCFRNGNIYFATHTYRKPLLGQLLIKLNLINESMLEEALDAQKTTRRGERLGNILVEMGYIRRDALESIVQEQIKEAVFNLLLWSDGEFEFDREMTFPEEDIGLAVSTEDLMIESERRMLEWNEIEKNVPSLDAVFQMTEAPGREDVEINLTSNEWLVLYQVDGTSTVKDIILNSQQSPLDTCRALSGLVSTGMIEIKEFKQTEGMPEAFGSLREQVAALEREGIGGYSAPIEELAGDETAPGSASVKREEPAEKEDIETFSKDEVFVEEAEPVNEPAGISAQSDETPGDGDIGSEKTLSGEGEKEYAGDDVVVEEKKTGGASQSLVDYYKKLALEEAANSEKLILFIESERKRTHESSEFSGTDVFRSDEEEAIGADTSPEDIPDFDEPESLPLEWSGHIARLRGLKKRGAESLRKKLKNLQVEQPATELEEKPDAEFTGVDEVGALEADETREAKLADKSREISAGLSSRVFEEESSEEASETEEISLSGGIGTPGGVEIIFVDDALAEQAKETPPVYEGPLVDIGEDGETCGLVEKPESHEDTTSGGQIYAEAPPEYIKETSKLAETGAEAGIETEVFVEEKVEVEKPDEPPAFKSPDEIGAQIEVEAESELESGIIAAEEIASGGVGVEIEEAKIAELEERAAGARGKPEDLVEEEKSAVVDGIEIKLEVEQPLEPENVVQANISSSHEEEEEVEGRALVLEQDAVPEATTLIPGEKDFESSELSEGSSLEEDVSEEKKPGILGKVLRFGKRRPAEKAKEDKKEAHPFVLEDEKRLKEEEEAEELRQTAAKPLSFTEPAQTPDTVEEVKAQEMPMEVLDTESGETLEIISPGEESGVVETHEEVEYQRATEDEAFAVHGTGEIQPEEGVLLEFEEITAGAEDFETFEATRENAAREVTGSLESPPVAEQKTTPREEFLEINIPPLSEQEVIPSEKEDAERISFPKLEETIAMEAKTAFEGISSAPSGGEVVETGVAFSKETDVEGIEIEGLTEEVETIPGAKESRASLEYAFELDVQHTAEVSAEDLPAVEEVAEEVFASEESASSPVEETVSFKPVTQECVPFEFEGEQREIEDFQGFELAADAHVEARGSDKAIQQEEERIEFGEVIPLVQAEEFHDAHAPEIDFDTALPLRFRKRAVEQVEQEAPVVDGEVQTVPSEPRIQSHEMVKPFKKGEHSGIESAGIAETIETGKALEKEVSQTGELPERFVAEAGEEAAAQREDETGVTRVSGDISKSLQALGENLPVLDKEDETVKSRLGMDAEEEENFLGGITVMGKREKGTCLVDLETLELEKELLEFAGLAKGKKKESVKPEEAPERGAGIGHKKIEGRGKALRDASGVIKSQKSQLGKEKTGNKKEKHPNRKIIKKIIEDLKKL